MLISVDK